MLAFVISASLFAISQCNGANKDGIFCSELKSPSGHATIVQSGPPGSKPYVRKEVGPGYSILEQNSGGNHSIVIQGDLTPQ